MKLFEAANSQADFTKPLEKHYNHLPPKERIDAILHSLHYRGDWSFTNGEEDIDGESPLIDLHSSLVVTNSRLKQFPFRIYSIEGSFIWANGNLRTLQGAPLIVAGEFKVNGNKLESLEGGPDSVRENYDCSENRLKSLKGAPEYIEESFFAAKNDLETLEGAPKRVKMTFDVSKNDLTNFEGAPGTIGTFNCEFNRISSLVGITKHVKQCGKIFAENNKIIEGGAELVAIKGLHYLGIDNVPAGRIIIDNMLSDKTVFDCQADLIDNGFEEFAK